MLPRLAVLLCVGLPWALPQAAEIYRWVDEAGRTQFSDTVPDKYKKSATRTDTRQFEVSDEQRREGEARAERERAKMQALEEQRARAKPAVQAPAKPKPAATATGDCAELHRKYQESLDCFAPFIQANGTTRAEAYSKCAVVKDPSPECGPPGSRESTSRSSR